MSRVLVDVHVVCQQVLLGASGQHKIEARLIGMNLPHLFLSLSEDDIETAITYFRGSEGKNAPLEASQLNLRKRLKQIEKGMIIRALEITKGNQSKATRLLGISRPRLCAKIKEHQIEDKTKHPSSFERPNRKRSKPVVKSAMDRE